MAGLLGKLKDSLFGSKEDTSLDKLDKTLEKIGQKLLNKDSLNSSDLVRDLLSKSSMTKDTSDFFQGISSNVSLLHENRDRIYRYINSEEIVDAIPYCAKALKIITDQVVSPDDINKKIIQIFEITDEKKTVEYSQAYNFVQNICKELHLDEIIYETIHDTLKLGDQFIEICNIESNDVPITHTLLTENENDLVIDSEIIHEDLKIPYFNETNELLNTREVGVNIKILMEKDESDTNLENPKNSKETVDLSNIRLILHDPSYVIKIQSARFRMCLGYLIIPKSENNTTNMNLFNTNNSGTQTLKQTNLYQNYSGINNDFYSGINQIYQKVLKHVKKHLTKNEEITLNKNETINILARSIKDVDDDGLKNFRIRYVPPERMQHFEIYNKRFFPYGESIFYKSTFQGKLLIALETAVTVKRLSDSTEKRVIYVESAGLPRNVKTTIENLKEGFKKRKYSLDSFGSIGSIPSYINTYEDYYIPQKNGKRFVEFDTLPPAINIRDISDELKFFRDLLVASLDVPPSFVSLEENSVTKANLAQESNVFARTVIAYQSLFGKLIDSLISKIYRFCRKELMPEIKITLSPPKLLQTEIYADQLDTIQRVANVLGDLGIPKDFVAKEYLHIDWEKVEDFKVKTALENRLKSQASGEVDEFGNSGGGFPQNSSQGF